MTDLDLDAGAEAYSLFVDDNELRRRMAPRVGRERFRAILRALERDGFPKVKELWGLRYWPAVKAWLDDRYGVRDNGFIGDAQDGPEDFHHACAQPATGVQARTPRPAVLDRQAGGAQPNGLPGRVHRLAARRR